MIIIFDTDILSAFAKIEALSLLKTLFSKHEIYITPEIYGELNVPIDYGYTFPLDIFKNFKVINPDNEEQETYRTFLRTNRRIGKGELEAISICISRKWIFSSMDEAAISFALVESAGFDPFIGFVHGLRYGRQSLPLDLVEESRHPVVDGLVMTVINNGSIKKGDFNKQDNGAYLLDKEAFRRFLGYYEERMEKLFLYREQDSQTSYRKLFQSQAEKIQKAVLNRKEYQPFLVR